MKKEIITNKELKEGFRDNWGSGGISDAGSSRREKRGRRSEIQSRGMKRERETESRERQEKEKRTRPTRVMSISREREESRRSKRKAKD